MTASLDLRQVATQFLKLTGLTIAELARRGEVHRPNCLAWLAGKEQVFSEKKQLKVCELLGWRFGRLRRDMVHRWEIGNDLSVLREVLAAYEGKGSDTTLMLFQAEGPTADKASVILGLCCDLGPLVILVQRPLATEMPVSLSAKALGMGFDGSPHKLCLEEWQEWWAPHSNLTQPADYLASYGQHLLDESERDLILFEQSQVFADAFEDEYSSILKLPAEQQVWLSLLAKAMDTGMAFDDILIRAENALAIKG